MVTSELGDCRVRDQVVVGYQSATELSPPRLKTLKQRSSVVTSELGDCRVRDQVVVGYQSVTQPSPPWLKTL